MTAFSDFDRRMMARVLELAERGAETTHPNPNVGCVLTRDDQIIAEGWHERAGGPHGEAAALEALRASGQSDARAATAYVNLEPCSHHGRTPPCADALISARVARVVFSIEDPNPEVAGKGAAKLRAAGIEVASGLMAAEAEAINEGFLKRMRTGRPFVRVKMAMSLDGRIALSSGASKWITGEAARADVQDWRARSSAILTGIGTVLADDPQLNVRKPGWWRQPTRVILDSQLRTPRAAKVLDATAPTVIFTRADNQSAALTVNGVRVERISATPAASIDLLQVVSRLGTLGMNDVLVEAGPTLAGALIQRGLADELLLYIAPKLLGPQARPLFNLPRLEDLQQAHQLRIIDHAQVGEDLRLRLRKP